MKGSAAGVVGGGAGPALGGGVTPATEAVGQKREGRTQAARR